MSLQVFAAYRRAPILGSMLVALVLCAGISNAALPVLGGDEVIIVAGLETIYSGDAVSMDIAANGDI